MPHYADLRRITDGAVRRRTVQGLQRLRVALAAEVPPRSAQRLLMATWNLREFDATRYGPRSEECYFYLAEVASRFDLIAVQEVRDSLYALQRLVRLLGAGWEYLVTDVTLGRSGNAERMAFVFDRSKVAFTGLAAELVLPRSEAQADAALGEPRQLARSPYIATFRAGWAYFTLVTVHIYYGTDTALDPRRLEEIIALARTIARHSPKFSGAPLYAPDDKPKRDNLLLLGDFNIFDRSDATMAAINLAGFNVPPPLQAIPGSNVTRNKHYDQIAVFNTLQAMRPTGAAGVFDFFEQVYREADAALYEAERAARPGRSFRDWRTYRMSDHLPMWIEFDIDDADAYLAQLLAA
ncbi:endonuclease/exonuclease/phosphatase family protein [Aquabacterium sp. OR-4]|uniref:endonuclease/exonuclease/phosphatase family protein n=1 Tax=Aquabacterium sp. OR-4 TaxID=2978127 RepID=UPI0021B4B8E7|nr:endonuclease/exonuclease/phosphatase family protein [Aquabacterium sp. OR-4]MDT7836162.1 endonuclease/exonuclease/phosphatase family protein [Aquabacterium sp. OR-4]